MKKRFTILMTVLFALTLITRTAEVMGQTKAEGFETATASTTYNSTVNLTTQQSDCGIAWMIYYGCVSTNNKISGNKSAQMRWYSSATSNRPYLESKTAIDGLTNVAFKAKVGNTNVKMDVHYSSDGNNWTALATAETFSNTSAADFSYTIPSGGKYIKIGVSSSSTAPGSGNYAFIVDDVVFTYSSSVTTHTVTYHANVTGISDIEVEYEEGDDVTIAANTFTNPGYAFTEWNTEADGSGDPYSPEDVINDIDDDWDLYAQWEESASTTGTINFGSATGSTAINSTSVTGNDSQNNTWDITTVFGSAGSSFTQNAAYSQVGSSSKPATSITFTTTLPEEVNVTAMEAKFGGFSGTAGTITMKVGNTTIGTGSLNGTADVVVNSSSTEEGDVLTVTVTSISKGVKVYYISYTYEAITPSPAVATTTTITVPANFNTDLHNGTTAGTLTATVTSDGSPVSGATVTWSSSETSVATVGSDGAVTLVAVGTTTITASYAGVEDVYKPSSDTYELTVIDSYAPGTQNNPYTVAQAIANTPSSGDVYIQGIVSSFYNTSIVGDGTNYRYYVSDDGTTTTQLLVYKGKGLNQATFSNVNDLLVGDEVVICGSLVTYQSAPEVASGNYLYSWNRPAVEVEAPTFSPAAGTYTTTQSVTISCATTGADIYYTTDGTTPDANSTLYTSAISVSTTTTIKAIAYYAGANSTVATATYHFCSPTDPYTVTEALAFDEYPANEIYVEGIVSTAPTQNPTSNGELTYYISVDGNATNQLEVYKGKGLNQAGFEDKTDIQVGDIVTVYGNVVIYNSTKEFAQGNYLVYFERPTPPTQEYTLSVGNPANITFTVNYGEEVLTNGESANDVENGTAVTFDMNIAEGYILNELTVLDSDSQPVTVTETSGVYSFTMPASNVTINASAVVAPATTTYTLATTVESGKNYIIVGQANGDYYAMGSDKGNNRNAYGITLDGTTASATVASGNYVHEFTITSLASEGFYSIQDATESGYLYAASSGSNYLKTESVLDENHNGDWEISINSETGVASVVASNSSYTRNVMQFNNGSILFACYSSASQHPVYLYVKDEPTTSVTYYYSVNGTLSEAHTCAVGSTKTLDAGTDLYSNFVFAGWTTDANDVSQHLTSYTFPDDTPVTFYANYSHTVTGIGTKYYTRVLNETATSDIQLIGPSIIPSFGILNMATYEIDNESGSPTVPYLVIEEGGQFIYQGEDIKSEIQKHINAPLGTWGQDDNTGWYALSSPVGRVSKLSEVDSLQLNPYDPDMRHFDFFAYSEKCGWYNKKDGEYLRRIDAGVGYLYAREESTTVLFRDYSNRDDVDLTNLTYTSSRGNLAGLHCIGNPYTHNIYKGVGITGDMQANYYALNEATGAWISTTDATAIVPMQAILVFVNKTDGTAAIHMTSDNSAPSKKANDDYIKFNVANSKYEDVAYAWFDNGESLNKISHRNSEVPMLYIPQNDGNYSIAYMSDNSEMFNLNFKAMTAGKYTLSVSEKGDFSYLHVYDRLTGEDVDMLLDSYTFIGSPADNEARFIVRLSYNASTTGSETFAFQNGSDVIVNGNGELQVFDLTGRMVMNTTVNGIQAVSMPQGVYVLRMIGENVQTQKIVVR